MGRMKIRSSSDFKKSFIYSKRTRWDRKVIGSISILGVRYWPIDSEIKNYVDLLE